MSERHADETSKDYPVQGRVGIGHQQIKHSNQVVGCAGVRVLLQDWDMGQKYLPESPRVVTVHAVENRK